MTEKTSSKKRRKYDTDFKVPKVMVASGKVGYGSSPSAGYQGEHYLPLEEQAAASVVSAGQSRPSSGCMAGSGPVAGKTPADRTKRDILKKPLAISAGRPEADLPGFIGQVEEEFPVGQLCNFSGKLQCVLRLEKPGKLISLTTRKKKTL